MSHGLQADAHYTWSRTRDMSTHSNGGGQTMDNYDIWPDYGPANWDIPHRFVASYIYDVPFLKNSSNADPEVCRGGMAGRRRHDVQSGTPVNVDIGADRANIGIPARSARTSSERFPRSIAGRIGDDRSHLINCYDASAFAMPAQFTFGNAPRNMLRGPKFVSTDLSLMKNVPLGGTAQFQIRAEIFNVFNTVNYGNPARHSAPRRSAALLGGNDAPGATRRQIVVALSNLRCSLAVNARGTSASARVHKRAATARPRRSLGEGGPPTRFPFAVVSEIDCIADVFEFVWRGDLELIVPALGRRLVRSPSQEDRAPWRNRSPCRWSVLHLADAFDAQRLPRRSFPALQRLWPPGMRENSAPALAHSPHG